MSYRDLPTRLAEDGIICAEGYLFELERRGYLQAGSFVPEVALENPDALLRLHMDFLHAGSDVSVAFTYNGHREKMRIMGKEDLLEPLNRAALGLARQAADEFAAAGHERPLVAGNISNTNVYDPDSPNSVTQARKMFDEMSQWAADEGADYIIAETLYFHGEAMQALEAVKAVGLPAVVTLAQFAEPALRDGVSPSESCKQLEDAGATVVGMNCFRGPATMHPLLKEIRAAIQGPMAALPVPYRTTQEHPTFFHLPDPGSVADIPHPTTFPTALDPLLCNRYEVADWAKEAWEMGIRYIGVCCGCAPVHVRAIAEALGRTPPASTYSPDMSKQFLFGDDPRLNKGMTDFSGKA